MNINTVFTQRPAMRTVVQLDAPLEITAPTSQLVKMSFVGAGLAPPPAPANPSTDPANRARPGTDGLLFVPEILIDPLAYYILAKAP